MIVLLVAFSGGVMMDIIELVKEYSIKTGIKVYLTGGAVRDSILKKNISDYDFTVDADCHAVAIRIAELTGGKYINMYNETARVVCNNEIFDFCSFKGKDINEDLKKRDFTINSLAEDLTDGKIIDVNNSINDIKNKIIKMTYGNAFNDDPLRMLRAVRISSETGFEIDKNTEEEIKKAACLIKTCSGERILDELYKIFESNKSATYIYKLNELNLIDNIFPVMKSMKKIGRCKYHKVDAYTHSFVTLKFLEDKLNNLYKEKNGDKIKSRFNQKLNGHTRLSVVKLGTFLHDIGKVDSLVIKNNDVHFKGHDIKGLEEFDKIAKTLPFSRVSSCIIKSIISGHMKVLEIYKAGGTDRLLYKFIKKFGENSIDIFVVSLFDISATRSFLPDNGETQNYSKFILDIIDKFYLYLDMKKFINGNDVKELTGYSGEKIGEVLNAVDEEEFCGNIASIADAYDFIKKNYNSQ